MKDLDLDNMPETVTKSIYPWFHPKFNMLIFCEHPPQSDSEYMQIGDPETVTFTLYKQDSKDDMINTLKQQRTLAQAKADREVSEINELIKKLEGQ